MYIRFITILRFVTSNNPYLLFDEQLPVDENILDALQLSDYLAINLFSLPLLKYETFVRSNSTDGEDQTTRVK